MSDPCTAGLWDIDPRETCPICGALPDTKCRGNEAAETQAERRIKDAYGWPPSSAAADRLAETRA